MNEKIERDEGSNSTPVLKKTYDMQGAKVTVHFQKASNPKALYLFKNSLISSIIRQANAQQ